MSRPSISISSLTRIGVIKLLILNQTIGHGETEDDQHAASSNWATKLRRVAVEEARDAVRRRLAAILLFGADDAVPAGAVLAVGKQAHGDHAPDAVDAVDRDGTDHVVDADACPRRTR